MSAAIVALPTAAAVPVVQPRRRGRLPGAVRSLTVYRQDLLLKKLAKRNEEIAQRNRRVEQVKNACVDAMRRSMSGEIAGLAILERYHDGQSWVRSTGEYMDDPARLERALYAAARTAARPDSGLRKP